MKNAKREYKNLTIFACELNDGLVSVEAYKTDTLGLSGTRAIYGGEHIYKAGSDLNGAIDYFIRKVVKGE